MVENLYANKLVEQIKEVEANFKRIRTFTEFPDDVYRFAKHYASSDNAGRFHPIMFGVLMQMKVIRLTDDDYSAMHVTNKDLFHKHIDDNLDELIEQLKPKPI